MRSFFVNTIYGFVLAGLVTGLPVAAGAQPKEAPRATLEGGPDTAVKPHQTTFFHVLNDVPVMPGLRELPDESINFDKPEGRIVTATAVSDHLAPEKIRQFYDQALPQLGWKRGEKDSFFRDQEQLKLIIEVKQGVSIARFTVEPR